MASVPTPPASSVGAKAAANPEEESASLRASNPTSSSPPFYVVFFNSYHRPKIARILDQRKSERFAAVTPKERISDIQAVEHTVCHTL